MNASWVSRSSALARVQGWRVVALAAAYIVMGQLGLALTPTEGFSALMWPPAGIAMGALVLHGKQLWPGICLGALILQLMIVDAFSPTTPLTAALIVAPLCIAAGATLQALCARHMILRLVSPTLALSGWHDALKLLLVAGPLSCLISSSCAMLALRGFGLVSSAELGPQWRAWWFGDMFGVLVFLPLMLIGPHARTSVAWRGTPVATLSLVALLTLLVPLAITLYAWRTSARFLQERAATAFAALASENERALQFRIESYEQALRAGTGFVRGAATLTRSQWRVFATSLDLPGRYPGMHGVGWIAAVPPQQLSRFLARIKSEENPQFELKPAGASAADTFIITYVEPETRNAPAIGLNIAFEPVRHAAALRARASRRATITHRLRLVQDRGQRAGFLLLQPVFRDGEGTPNSFLGWVYAPLIGEDLLAALTNAQGQLFSLQVFDGAARQENLIYSSSPTTARRSHYRLAKRILVGQQPWELRWDSTARFEADTRSLEPSLILIVGLLTTILFAAFLLTARHRERAVAGLVRDQSLQLQASQLARQASEATLRAAMEHAPIGIALVDPSGRWLQANRACCDILGYAPAELQDLDFQAITHPQDLPLGLDLLRQLLGGASNSSQVEARCLHKQGHYVWVLLALALVRDSQGAPHYLVAQLQDITQRREMDRMKSEFISTVSHELRTPLTSIRGALGLLDSGRLGAIPAKASQMVRIAHTNSERLIRIINDILDIEKIESGSLGMAIDAINLARVLRQSMDAYQAYAQKYSVELHLDAVPEELEVLADADRLMQVMANLLSNAAKFSPAGARIMVRVVAQPDSVVTEVQDFGEGIPEAFHARIFEKFVQAESSTARRFEGTGLGLAITKQLVEAMRGTITFTSQPGCGTTFRVTLPRPAPAVGREVRDAVHLQTSPGMEGRSLRRILHVEDDQDLSRVLQVALTGRAELVHAGTLAEAQQRLARGGYALLLVDLHLPDGDGAQLVAEWSAHLPTVVLSVSEASAAVRSKARACLIKSKMAESAIIEQLLAVIESAEVAARVVGQTR